MKALVTGSSGLVGRHMTKRLEADGWDVEGWDIAEGNDAHTCFSLDKKRYDLIIHAAYHVGGRAGIDGVNRNFARNVALDGAMFDWAARTGQQRVLYFSSSAAYPVGLQTEIAVENGYTSLNEDYIQLSVPELPDANYGWSKLTGEMLARDARKNGVNVTVVRPFSGYAADQTLDYPFPSIISRAIKGEYNVWGPVGQTRDWVNMEDAIGACLALVKAEVDGPVNLCTGRGMTMEQVMREAVWQLHSLFPHEYPHGEEIEIEHLTDKPTGVFHRVGDPTLMLKHYTPKITVEQGIARTIAALLARS